MANNYSCNTAELPDLPAERGTYLIESYCPDNSQVLVGARGKINLIKGYYYYVGSAFGPGGLHSRLRHHLLPTKKPHWHLDYIKPHLCIRGVFYSIEPQHLEHQWAQSLLNISRISAPFPGLGATDCTCISHFFYANRPLPQNHIFQIFQSPVSYLTVNDTKIAMISHI